MPNLQALLKAAAKARKNAYAPYSGFPVGAAVEAAGEIFSACNVENSSYPLAVCAERNAVAAAVAAGHRRLDAVAVVGGEARPAAPCGGCRQVLAEFAPGSTPLVYASADGEAVETTVGALLPDAFGPLDLTEAEESSRTRPARSTKVSPGKRRSATRGRGIRNSGR